MKIFLLIMMATISLTQSHVVFASGCMWYDEYMLGQSIGTKEVVGVFECEEATKGLSYCRFLPTDSKEKTFFTEMIALDKLPPVNQPLLIHFESYEAMQWENCDGSDPAPPFVRNGIYDFFNYDGVKYNRFVQDQGR